MKLVVGLAVVSVASIVDVVAVATAVDRMVVDVSNDVVG